MFVAWWWAQGCVIPRDTPIRRFEPDAATGDSWIVRQQGENDCENPTWEELLRWEGQTWCVARGPRPPMVRKRLLPPCRPDGKPSLCASPDLGIVSLQGRRAEEKARNELLEIGRTWFRYDAAAAESFAGCEFAPTPPHLVIVDDAPTEPDACHTPDTAPDDRAPGWHGRALADIVCDLVCDGDECPVAVTRQLAIQRAQEGYDGNPGEDGGFYGSTADLARGIRDAVDGAAGGRTVLNLSVGWNPAWGEDTTGAELVQAMIDWALCDEQHYNHVLAFAAAGNRSTGPNFQGEPVYPAAWTVAGGGICQNQKGGPLLVAVGGVQGDGGPELHPPLSISRANAEPPLVAIGEGGTGGERLPIHGTSVATAVASATAALIWAAEPTLSAAEVLDVLHDTGLDVERTSAFAGATAARDVRMVQLCPALQSQCAKLDCTSVRPDPYVPPEGAIPPAVFLDAAKSKLRAWSYPGCSERPYERDRCEVGGSNELSSLFRRWTRWPCIADQFYSGDVRPYVATEPEEDGCTGCPPLVLDVDLNVATLAVVNGTTASFRPNLELGYGSSTTRTIQLKSVGANTTLTQTFTVDELRGPPPTSGALGPLPINASLTWMASGQPVISHLMIQILPQ